MTVKPRGKKDFVRIEDLSLEHILASLLDDKNIEMKTEIYDAKDLAGYSTFSEFLKEDGFKAESKYMDVYLKAYLLFNVSKDRKRSLEIVEAVRSLYEREKIRLNFSEKLNL